MSSDAPQPSPFGSTTGETELLSTLLELGREVTSVLDLTELLAKIPQLIARLTRFSAFAAYLLDGDQQELRIAHAVGYPDDLVRTLRLRIGQGVVGSAVEQGQPILVQDIRDEPRFVGPLRNMASQLAVPMQFKGRAIGALNLLSEHAGAFAKRDEVLLSQFAAHVAVAIENARLYDEIRRNEERIEKELRFAQRVQVALLPTDLPPGLRAADVAGQFSPAREIGGDLHDFIAPESDSLVVAVGDVSGKGAPAALYGAFVTELARRGVWRRRFIPDTFSVAGVLRSMNTILHDRQLEDYYCTLCYAVFDFARRVMAIANSGLPYPIHCSGEECAQIALPGVPLGLFAGVTYDELSIPLRSGDVFVFCTDGIFEASTADGTEFGAERVCELVALHQTGSAREIVDALFDAVHAFRGTTPQEDDMTAVAIKITG